MTVMTNTASADLDPARENPKLSWAERLSDRVSPILVREIQQALKGRVFMVTLGASVIAIIGIAFVVLMQGHQSPRMGRDTFSACLTALAPIIIFIVPQQAYLSMRHEVSEGTAEQLILTRLTPMRIVLGKLSAAMMQFLLFLAVFSPIMALTFLLRGVDVPTIGLMLVLAALASLVTTTFAIAVAALGRMKIFSQLMLVLVTAGLFGATIWSVAAAWELVGEIPRLLNSPDFWLVVLSILFGFSAAMGLCIMTAAAALAHSYENRSTQFRVFAVGLLLTAVIWSVFVVDARYMSEVGPGLAGMAALFGLPFYLWAACEPERLSVRVAGLLPRNPLLRTLSIPFLPGGGRGMIFTWCLAALSLGLGYGLGLIFDGGVDEEVMGVAVIAWGYALIYVTYGRLIRCRFAATSQRSLLTALLVLLTALALMLLPFLLQVLIFGSAGRWNPTHMLSVGMTINHYVNNSRSILVPGAVVSGALAIGAFGIGSMLRGMNEVKHAAREAAENRRKVEESRRAN